MEHEKIGQRSWDFVISHGILPILPPNLTKFVFVLVTAKKLSRNLESPHSPQNVVNAKSGRQMVIDNQEMVMEKSWKNILSSMWEP